MEIHSNQNSFAPGFLGCVLCYFVVTLSLGASLRVHLNPTGSQFLLNLMVVAAAAAADEAKGGDEEEVVADEAVGNCLALLLPEVTTTHLFPVFG